MKFINRYFEIYHIIRDLHNYKVYTRQELVERFLLEDEEHLDAILAIADELYVW